MPPKRSHGARRPNSRPAGRPQFRPQPPPPAAASQDKEAPIELDGTVSAVLAGTMFRVKLRNGHEVLALDYEAWEDRAPAQLESIAREVAGEHGLRAVLAVHRIGRVEVGEAAVVIVAVGVHRDAAFVGARALIDRVKDEAWIWKKELRVGGEVWIEGC